MCACVRVCVCVFDREVRPREGPGHERAELHTHILHGVFIRLYLFSRAPTRRFNNLSPKPYKLYETDVSLTTSVQ